NIAKSSPQLPRRRHWIEQGPLRLKEFAPELSDFSTASRNTLRASGMTQLLTCSSARQAGLLKSFFLSADTLRVARQVAGSQKEPARRNGGCLNKFHRAARMP